MARATGFSLALICVVVAATCVHHTRDEGDKVVTRVRRMAGYHTRSNLTREIVDQIINLYFPASEAVENQLCRRHSEIAKAAIKTNEGFAMEMLDASSKVPSGLWMGNEVQLGNYDECLNVQSDDETWSPDYFMGQHCMVSNVFYYEKRKNQTKVLEDADLVLRDFLRNLGVKWSVCIPSSCTPRDLEAHMVHVLGDEPLVKVQDNACRSRAHPTVLTPADWFAIGLFTIFAVVVALSTVYDIWNQNSESRSNLLVAFSLYTNGRRLLTVSSRGDELKALHAIRTFSMIWVAVGHTYDISEKMPAVNLTDMYKLKYDWQHAHVMSYRLAVDAFLLFSGLLLCYGFLRKTKRGDTFNVPLYYLHRYIRLTPAYAAMILFTATLLAYTGDGPTWEQLPIQARDACKYYWWTNMIYLNNYVHIYGACIPQSWYLSLDMQLYILSPLLIYPLWRWRRFGKVLLGVVGFTGLLIAFLISYIYNFYGLYGRIDLLNKMEYLPTYTRFVPWVLGIALGYLLHSYRSKPVQLSRWQVTLGWLLCCLLLLTPGVVNRYLHEISEEEHRRWFNAFNSALNRSVFALGVSWIIFACNNGYGGIVNSFFSWKLFTVLSRLTYCSYLVHYGVITWMAGSTKAPLYLSDRTVIIMAFNVIVISFIGALLLSLVFEVPALNLEKILFNKDRFKVDNTIYVVGDGNVNDATNVNELVSVDCDGTSRSPERT